VNKEGETTNREEGKEVKGFEPGRKDGRKNHFTGGCEGLNNDLKREKSA